MTSRDIHYKYNRLLFIYTRLIASHIKDLSQQTKNQSVQPFGDICGILSANI